ncbi:MAG: RNA-binding protein, partial [Herminiimonas sp.]|nr:RNA-binding protein [Herminiimonas sp.]
MTTDTVRIDKWLWAARFFKTRSLATDAVDAGKVRLKGERTKPSRNVKIGDTLDIDNGATEWQIVVQNLSDTRGSASIA